MTLSVYQVDSFTSEAFKGNPAGVCITPTSLPEELMFAIAQEMAVSETAFLALNNMQLRWFTPEVEVALCGHGTLATAQVLLHNKLASIGDDICFNTLSGELKVAIREDHIAMDFPAPQLIDSLDNQAELLTALGIESNQVVTIKQFDNKQMIVLKDSLAVLSLKPNFSDLLKIKGRGVVVTASASNTHSAGKYDFISRYFAPWVGVNEDPVTGSAHCALAVYWCQQLNKAKLTGYQASKRGGFVGVEFTSNNRVTLTGQAKLILEGKMYIPK